MAKKSKMTKEAVPVITEQHAWLFFRRKPKLDFDALAAAWREEDYECAEEKARPGELLIGFRGETLVILASVEEVTEQHRRELTERARESVTP